MENMPGIDFLSHHLPTSDEGGGSAGENSFIHT
jgi:hypothetical protein